MYQGPQDTRILTGVMDQDSALWAIAPQNYRYALNLINIYNQQRGSHTNIVSNVEVINSDLKTGINKCVGTFEDIKGGSVIFAVYNSLGYHGWFRYYQNKAGYPNGAVETIYQVRSPSSYTEYEPNPLDFDPDYLITGINLVDDLLFWTDKHSSPKMMNIARANLTGKKRVFNIYFNDQVFGVVPLGIVNGLSLYQAGVALPVAILSWTQPVTVTTYAQAVANMLASAGGSVFALSAQLEDKGNYVQATVISVGDYYLDWTNNHTTYSGVVIAENFYPDITSTTVSYSALKDDLIERVKYPPRCQPSGMFNSDTNIGDFFINIDNNRGVPNNANNTNIQFGILPIVSPYYDNGGLIVTGPTKVLGSPIDSYIQNPTSNPLVFSVSWNLNIQIISFWSVFIPTTQLEFSFNKTTSGVPLITTMFTWNAQYAGGSIYNIVGSAQFVLNGGERAFLFCRTENLRFQLGGSIQGFVTFAGFGNFLSNKYPSFRSKYIYDDNQNSVYGAISNTLVSKNTSNNYVDLDFTDPRLESTELASDIKNVVLAVSLDSGVTWNDFATLDPYEYVGVGRQKYRYRGTEVLIAVPESEAIIPFHDVPLLSKSQEFIDDRIWDGEIVRGYDKVDLDLSLEVKYESVLTGEFYGLSIANPPYSVTRWKRGWKGYLGVVYYDDADRKTPVCIDIKNSYVEIPFYTDRGDIGESVSGGKNSPTGVLSSFFANGLNFTLTQSAIIQSVDIYPVGTAVSLPIQVLDLANNIIQTGIFPIPANLGGLPYTVPLNFSLSTGTYRLVIPPGAIPPGPLFIYDSFSAISYGLGGYGSITSGYSNAALYTYFYNWQLAPISSLSLNPAYLTAAISSAPPSWAKKYQFVRSQDLSQQAYLVWCADELAYVNADDTIVTTTPSPTTKYIRISIDNIAYYNDDVNKGAKIGFTFVNGDRVRFIQSSLGVFFQDNNYVIAIVVNTFVYIVYDGSIQPSDGCMIEFYTPRLESENLLYFEFGECYDIEPVIQNGIDIVRHKGETQDQVFPPSPLTTVTPAITVLKTGDVWYRARNLYYNTITTPIPRLRLISSSTPSDFTDEDYDNNSRPNLADLPGRTYQDTGLNFSDQYISGTLLNGLAVVQPANYKQFSTVYGGMDKMIVVNNDILKLFFRNGYQLSIYVNQGVIRQTQGGQNIISVINEVANNSHLIERSLGTINAESVVLNDEGDVFGYDGTEGVCWMSPSNGLVDVSDTGMSITWRNYGLSRLALGGTSQTPSVFDLSNQQYIITLNAMLPHAEVMPKAIIKLPNIADNDVLLGTNVTITVMPNNQVIYNAFTNVTSWQTLLPPAFTGFATNLLSDGSVEIIAPNVVGYAQSSILITVTYNSSSTTYTFPFEGGQPASEGDAFPAVTLSYNKERRGWINYYSFTPEMYGRLRNQVVSFVDGKLFTHANGVGYNNFYGVQYSSLIRYILNNDYPKVKVPLSLWYRGLGVWGAYMRNLPTASYPWGQETQMTPAHFLLEEDGYYAPVMKNKLDPRYPSTDQAWVNGEDIRGDATEIELYNDQNTQARLDSSKTIYLYSENS